MSSNCVFISLILTTILCHLASYEASGVNQGMINKNFMKMNEKFDFLSEKVNKLEENSSAGNDTISNAIEQLNKQTQELEKANTKILQMLAQVLESINDQKMNKRDVMNEMTSQCTSLCQSKVNILAKESQEKLHQVDFCIDNKTIEKTTNSCDPNPCSNGGQCQLTSYYCTKCPHLRSGKHCEILSCNLANKCFRYLDDIYVVFEQHMTWDEANNKCIVEGMRLATPKDKESTEFLITELKKIYLPTQYKHFYIGLKNEKGSAEWRWTDGSLLGAYTGGFVNLKAQAGHQFGILYLHGATVLWYPQNQSAILLGSTYYPLCTKLIS